MNNEELRIILLDMENRLRRLEGREPSTSNSNSVKVSGVPYEVEKSVFTTKWRNEGGHWLPYKEETKRKEYGTKTESS